MIFSIGHSVHTPEEFVPLVRGIDVIVDVRSHPTSRWEQWRLEHMRQWLPAAGLEVEWIPELGGWTADHYRDHHKAMAEVGVDLAVYSKGAFPKQRIAAPTRSTDKFKLDHDRPFWRNQGLYDYAWYMQTDDFATGLKRLIASFGHSDRNCAILCAEALWWKCHRSMIADVLLLRGIDVMHLPPKLPKRPATPRWAYHSRVVGNRIERYPNQVRDVWRQQAH